MKFPEMKLAWMVIGVILLMLMVALSIFPDKSAPFEILRVAAFAGLNVPIIFWCWYDSRERGEQLNGMALMILIFGFIALIYYLFQSRGLKRGFLSLAVLVGLFLAGSVFGGLAGEFLGRGRILN